MWYMSPCSNRRGILRIQSGTDGVWENTPKNIYFDNSPKTVDIVDYHVCMNGSVRYDSTMTGNPKHQVISANVVRGVMRKH